MKRNRLKITMESRIHGDVYVRFGGERLETYRPKGRQGALRLACGTGKTLIMCTAAFEMKRLGLANKPMIIGLKSNVHDIADTFKRAYPNAKVLYPGKEDFTPEKRIGIFHDIKKQQLGLHHTDTRPVRENTPVSRNTAGNICAGNKQHRREPRRIRAAGK